MCRAEIHHWTQAGVGGSELVSTSHSEFKASLHFKKSNVDGEVNVQKPPVLLHEKGCRVKQTNQTSERQSTLSTAFISISISRQYSVQDFSSPWQQGKMHPSCSWKGTGYLHHAKGAAALPTHWGKLIKLGTVQDLSFYPVDNATVGKGHSGLSSALSLTHSLAGAVQELLCGWRCDWKKKEREK